MPRPIANRCFMESLKNTLFILFFISFTANVQLEGRAAKYRITWRENPSTTMVIGWEQVSGNGATVYYDSFDYGKDFSRYRFSQLPNKEVEAMGMRNQFARLRGLLPNTVYYFVIKDSEGVSRRFSFKTAPNSSRERLSIIAGGDSRNHRIARQNANKLVAKLRPHCVMFSGDMTNNDTPAEWQTWLNDWQMTIAGDGRMTPIIPARGNHEKDEASLRNLFDIKSPEVYYALSLGGDLLRIYTLNSSRPAGGNQRTWLERDLNAHPRTIWKFAQYHESIRPHTARKPEKNDQFVHWSTLFYHHKVRVVLESDAHVVKTTWPIRPSNEPGSAEGFIRDDYNGTVYLGEGGWGAPLRTSNDRKPWTRDMDSFNQFKLIFADANKVEIRTIQTENADRVGLVSPDNIFALPAGLAVWNPPNGGVITVAAPGKKAPPTEQEFEDPGTITKKEGKININEFSIKIQNQQVFIQWSTGREPKGVIYHVERSVDKGQTYQVINKMNGFGHEVNNYECPDNYPVKDPDVVSYRIEQIMPDGNKHYYFPLEDARESTTGWEKFPMLLIDGNGKIKVAYALEKAAATVTIHVLNPRLKDVSSVKFTGQTPGKYLKTLDMNRAERGRYLVVVRADGKPIRRFRVDKR